MLLPFFQLPFLGKGFAVSAVEKWCSVFVVFQMNRGVDMTISQNIDQGNRGLRLIEVKNKTELIRLAYGELS